MDDIKRRRRGRHREIWPHRYSRDERWWTTGRTIRSVDSRAVGTRRSRLTLFSAVELARQVLPGMKERRWGRILNITSIAVKQPVENLLLSNSLRAGSDWICAHARERSRSRRNYSQQHPAWLHAHRASGRAGADDGGEAGNQRRASFEGSGRKRFRWAVSASRASLRRSLRFSLPNARATSPAHRSRLTAAGFALYFNVGSDPLIYLIKTRASHLISVRQDLQDDSRI